MKTSSELLMSNLGVEVSDFGFVFFILHPSAFILHSMSDPKNTRKPWAGVLHWILTNRYSRIIVPPLVFVGIVISLATPLWHDLKQLSQDDLVLVQPGERLDGELIVNVKNINPNNGIATLGIVRKQDPYFLKT